MTTLVVVEPGSAIRQARGALEVSVRGRYVCSIPTANLDRLVLVGAVEVSASARRQILDTGASVLYLTRGGRFLGLCEPFEARNARRRRKQLAALQGERGLVLARALIVGKLRNQRMTLLRRQRRIADPGLAKVLVALRHAARRAESAKDVATLRGIEGAGSARYFDGFATALAHHDLAFHGRSHYPPTDPVNACLSFAYTLLLGRVIDACWRAGLDPYAGVLHDAGRGAPELALDLIEEWRPLVDRMVLRVVNRRQLGPRDFRAPAPEELRGKAELADMACYLTKLGARVIASELDAVLRVRLDHPLEGKRRTAADLVKIQAQQVAALVEERTDVYVPVALEH